MKKNLLLLFFLLAASVCLSQKFVTKTGKIHFEASVPLFEDVDATNSQAVAVINMETGEIASVAQVKNFKFKTALMEEHFNENYAESSKYPKTSFSGRISDFNPSQISSVPRSCSITGTLAFHGVSHRVTSAATIYRRDGMIFLSGRFTAKPGDYQVTIPSVLTKKIAEKVNIDYHFELVKQ